MSDTYYDQPYFDEDYKSEYDEDQKARIKEVEDEDLREMITDELQQMKYKPTSSGKADSELNFLKAMRNIEMKQRGLNSAAKSLLRFKAEADGKSKTQIQRWANRVMREKD